MCFPGEEGGGGVRGIFSNLLLEFIRANGSSLPVRDPSVVHVSIVMLAVSGRLVWVEWVALSLLYIGDQNK